MFNVLILKEVHQKEYKNMTLHKTGYLLKNRKTLQLRGYKKDRKSLSKVRHQTNSSI